MSRRVAFIILRQSGEVEDSEHVVSVGTADATLRRKRKLGVSSNGRQKREVYGGFGFVEGVAHLLATKIDIGAFVPRDRCAAPPNIM